MKILNFGCRRSEFLTTNSKGDWFIQCRFYEPGRDRPFTYRRKLNRFKTLKERKELEKLVLKDMIDRLDKHDYNPRTKQYMFQQGDINPYLSVMEALALILEKKDFTPEHRRNVETDLQKFASAIEKRHLEYLKIKDIELLHVKSCLESLELTNYGFNKAKIHLSSLFTDLVDAGCIAINPCTGIKAKKHIIQKKEIFTDDELAKVSTHIRENYPHFYNFFQIFFLSGCRVPELLGVQKKHVNLEKAEFTILLKKGALYIEEKRAIVPNAIPFWESQMQNAIFDDDYIFSYFYHPGTEIMHRTYIYKFWRQKVMSKTGINKSIYTLKHTFLDKVEEANFSAQIAAGHRNDSTTSIYTVGREKRRLEAQKQILISAI